ncbi:MAG TPA: 3-phosphoshikimate 1-carboxyvinyltransferase [Terriglobia bacterium]|nr:3-phosphoshikimate 1-carboxyvinyltransferase [Terriglobia bacterium]
MHSVTVIPVKNVQGHIRIPGDKSISHRLAMIGAIAEGPTIIRGFAESADCQSTLGCLRRLGIPINRSGSDGSTVQIDGKGLDGLTPPREALDAGNSGSTVRMLSGILAGRPFASTFIGDHSLSRRPMKRIIEPLERFGCSFRAREGNYLPLMVSGGSLKAIDYTLPIASAQVKSAILLAGLQAQGTTRVTEPAPSRNHTELALAAFGATLRRDGPAIEIEGGQRLRGGEFDTPGDLSSAAFPIAAAAGVPGSHLELPGVGVNVTRSGFLTLIEQMGARVRMENVRRSGEEPVADLIIEGTELDGAEVAGAMVPNVIDEIPVLAALALRTRRGIRFRDAAELRAKESDRIRSVVTNLTALGLSAEEFPDGFYVPGGQTPRAGAVDSFGDHRIAMAFAVAGLFAEGPVTIQNADCVGISFPGFFGTLEDIVVR